MKLLTLKKNDFGLRVHCSKCNRNYNAISLKRCKHSQHQSYKSIVYRNGGTKVRHFQTRNFEEALVQAIHFKKEVKLGILDEARDASYAQNTILTVVEAAERFVAFKHGDTKFEHLKRDYSKKYLSSIKLFVQQFIDVLSKHGIDKESMPVKDIDDYHVSIWWKYIQERYPSEASWNGAIRIMRLWIDYVIKREKVEMTNPFKDVKLRYLPNQVQAITKEEFESVCIAVEMADPYVILKGDRRERKNRYRSYLIQGFKLGLYTGLRREEIVSLKWSDIEEVQGADGFVILTKNLKVERITGRPYRPKVVPIHKQLFELLLELGWEEFADSDLFILEPFRNVKLQTMMDSLSKGFSHYYSKAFPQREIKQFKVLRKTYLTYLHKSVGDDIVKLSSHGSMKVLEEHYIDRKVITRGAKVKIFN